MSHSLDEFKIENSAAEEKINQHRADKKNGDTNAVKFRIGDLKQLINEHQLEDDDLLFFKFAKYTEDDFDRYEKKDWLKHKLKRDEFCNRTTLIVNFLSRKEQHTEQKSMRDHSSAKMSYDFGGICPPPEGCEPDWDEQL